MLNEEPEYQQEANPNHLPGVRSTLVRHSVISWTLHWVSAVLVFYLIATSLASGMGMTNRAFPAIWLNWHLSAGIVLLVVTVIRLVRFDAVKNLNRPFALSQAGAVLTRTTLLLAVFVTTISGLLIYQKPPFGPVGYIFGLFPMPTLIRLRHSLHSVAINFHILLAGAISLLLIIHILRARSRLMPMLWPWGESI